MSHKNKAKRDGKFGWIGNIFEFIFEVFSFPFKILWEIIKFPFKLLGSIFDGF